MSIVNGYVEPDKPIGLHELAGMLGCGADTGQCCTSERINKWSRRKPIAPVATDASSSPPFADTPKELPDYVFQLANYGLSFKIYRNLDSLKAGFGQSQWTYIKPGAGHFKRITDFAGYYHHANTPLPYIQEGQLVNPGSGAFQIPLLWNDYDENTTVPLKDLHVQGQDVASMDFNNFYIGLCFIKGNRTLWATNEKTGLREIEVKGSLPETGEWSVWLFLSSVSFNTVGGTGSLPSSGYFIPLDQEEPTTIVYSDERPDMSIRIYGDIQESTGKGTVTIEFYRLSSGSFSNVFLRLVAGSNQISDESRIIYEENIGTVTVGNDSTVTRKISFTANSKYNNFKGQDVWAVLNVQGMTVPPVPLEYAEE